MPRMRMQTKTFQPPHLSPAQAKVNPVANWMQNVTTLVTMHRRRFRWQRVRRNQPWQQILPLSMHHQVILWLLYSYSYINPNQRSTPNNPPPALLHNHCVLLLVYCLCCSYCCCWSHKDEFCCAEGCWNVSFVCIQWWSSVSETWPRRRLPDWVQQSRCCGR